MWTQLIGRHGFSLSGIGNSEDMKVWHNMHEGSNLLYPPAPVTAQAGYIVHMHRIIAGNPYH
jgi:hypothetical protein